MCLIRESKPFLCFFFFFSTTTTAYGDMGQDEVPTNETVSALAALKQCSCWLVPQGRAGEVFVCRERQQSTSPGFAMKCGTATRSTFSPAGCNLFPAALQHTSQALRISLRANTSHLLARKM